MDTFIGIFLVCFMGFFAYVTTVMLHEQKTNKRIPLIWEKDFWKKP